MRAGELGERLWLDVLGLLLWLGLLVAPWAVHVAAVESVVLTPEWFWLAAPVALLAVLAWMYLGPSDGEGVSSLGWLMLWMSASWVVVQTTAALGVFLWKDLGPRSLWTFALWLIVATAALFVLLLPRLRAHARRARRV